MHRKIIFLEVNEVPERILDGFASRYPDSAFSRILPRCQRYVTVAADTCALSPWITWPTVHRGVNNEKHGILHFGQDLLEADQHYPPIWELLSRAGIKTGVFAPLHSSSLPPDPGRYEFFLPDTFAPSSESYPAALTAFQAFNLAMARQSPRNVSRSLDLPTLARFLARAPQLGLRPETAFSILRHLFEERIEKWKTTRRRTYQPVVAFDLFMKQLASRRPEFSNFFTNHVASAMHRYWAALHPEDYEDLELTEEWRSRFSGEIDFSMTWADRFFDRLVQFADRNPEFIVVVASSMGQQAAHGERLESQLYLREPARLLELAGFDQDQWETRPAMDPTVSIFVKNERAIEFESFLKRLEIAGEPVSFSTETKGFFDLMFGQPNLDPATDLLTLDGQTVAYENAGLQQVTIEDEAGSTGYHQPNGILLVYDPVARNGFVGPEAVPTTDIAPALLEHFKIALPNYMHLSGAFRLPS